MRVLFLTWRGPEDARAGGAEAYVRRIADGLAARGHAVTWFCEGRPDAGEAPWEPPPGGPAEPGPERPGFRIVAGGRGLGQRCAAARFAVAHRSHFDVVVDQIAVAGFLAPLWSPLPVLALVHQRAGPEVWALEGPAALRRAGPAFEALMLRPYRDTPFVTVSQTTLSDLRAAGLRGRAHVAYNGVDPPRRSAAPARAPRPTLVFLGRLQARAKRLPDAIAAWRLVQAELPDTELWVVGRGPAPREAPPGVDFHPDVSAPDRDALLQRAWLLVATSAREGWGRMVLEAAAAGTASAVYPAPGLVEAARATAGVVARQESPRAMADLVVPLLRDPARLRAMGEAAREAALRFRWPDAVDVWEEALRKSMAGPGARRR